MAEIKLTAEKVREIIMDCLFKEEELDSEGKPNVPAEMVEGVVRNFGFNKERLQKHKDTIVALLKQLPEQFNEGWSFLNMCVDKEGNQWGEQRDVEELVCLGLGIGKVRSCFPREMWKVLPGGVPYYIVLSEESAAH